MTLSLLSFSFKTTPIEFREPLSVAAERLPALLRDLRERAALNELMVLSTCNRVEFYFTAADEGAATAALLEILQERLPKADQAGLAEAALTLSRREALSHLFRVAASLESMVVGEPQILGQVKDAFQIAAAHQATGTVLGRVVPQALRTAKRVRTETQIARFPVSISYVAVQLAQRIFDSLTDQTVLVIGAGEMAELAVEQLVRTGIGRLLLTNRTLSTALSLAERFQGVAYPFEQLPTLIAQADIVVSSTGARGFVVTREVVRQAMRVRRGKSMFLIDIAVPRDVEPSVNELSNVYRYDVDDLQSVAESNRKEREREAQAAQTIVQQDVDRYLRGQDALESVPTVRALRSRFAGIGEQELNKALVQLKHLGSQDQERIQRLVRTLVNKLLHAPSMRLKQAADLEESRLFAEALTRLFDLDTATQHENQEAEAGRSTGQVLHLPISGKP